MANPETLDLLSYAPASATLDPQEVIRARARLESYLAELWPELDTRPNSVFGDLFLTPSAALLATLEIGMRRFQSDLDLTQLSQGIVFNPTFARAYLKNFGISDNQTSYASGLVWMIFDSNDSITIDTGMMFSPASQNVVPLSFTTSGQPLPDTTTQIQFWINPGVSNPLIVGVVGDNSSGYSLFPTGDGNYAVALPVQGTPGANVADGTQMLVDQEITGLVQVLASGDFDPGSPALSVPAMARLAVLTYPSSSLSSRAGLLSFFRRQLPNILWVGATVSGQSEMIRPGKSVLGLTGGAGDVFIRTRSTWAAYTFIQTLVYNFEAQAWMGSLELPHVPAFFHPTQGIFQGTGFNTPGTQQTLYARSRDPQVDSVGVSYSSLEQLGVSLMQGEISNFTEAYLSPVTRLRGAGLALTVTGKFNGSLFSRSVDHQMRLQLGDNNTDAAGQPYISATSTNAVTGAVLALAFYKDEKGTTAYASTLTPGYNDVFSGMTLALTPDIPGVWPSVLGSQAFAFNFNGRTAQFSVSYLYDPLLPNVQATLNNPDYQPINVSLLARSPLVCEVTSLRIYYRSVFGQTFDRTQTINILVEYINSLGYPQMYDDSTIGAILQSQGIAMVTRIEKVGRFYPSLASQWQNADGSISPIPHYITTTLLPVANKYGVGPHNITWWIAAGSIQLVAVAA